MLKVDAIFGDQKVKAMTKMKWKWVEIQIEALRHCDVKWMMHMDGPASHAG